LKISQTGRRWATDPEFSAFVGAICRYTPAVGFEALTWYIAASLCCDSLCNLPISDYRELADFLENHQAEIAACIAGAEA
jgi:hypothetical protein